MSKLRYHQGIFRPKNPKKYKGNHKNIVYRSSLEYKVMTEMDINVNVLEWASEEHWFTIPYRSPIDNKLHRYFPDFWAKLKTKNDTIETVLIEVKPHKQTLQPPMTKNRKIDKRFMKQAATFAINSAKWDAAQKYCNNKGWQFKILTEKHIQ